MGDYKRPQSRRATRSRGGGGVNLYQLNHMERYYCSFSLCSGSGTPPPSIDHYRRLCNMDIAI